MNNHNGRPMGMRKTVQLLVILTILAWATQVLFHQWGYGAVIVPSRQALLSHAASEKTTETVRTIEVRPQAIASSGDGNITLRDVCRWNEDDQAGLSPYADVVISKQSGSITIAQIKSALSNAGADLKSVKFSGAATCSVIFAASDAPQVREFANAVVDSASPAKAETAADGESTSTPAAPTTQPQQVEGYFQDQLVLTRSLSSGQALIKSDIAVKHTKIDAPATQPSLSIDQVIGQVATRDLKVGDTIAAADVKTPQSITAGQFMTVSLNVGQTTVETVAKAMNDGSMGDIIKAKNEANGDVYTVQVTGANTAQQITSSNPSNDHGVATTDNGAN